MSAADLDFLPVDLSEFRDWPELRALAQALDTFAERAGRETALTQTHAERRLVALARNLAASDWCPECDAPEPCPPFALEVDHRDGGAVATYRCARGHEWRCWWGSRGAVLEVG